MVLITVPPFCGRSRLREYPPIAVSEISKSAGATFVRVVKTVEPGSSTFYYVYGTFFTALIGAWFTTAFLLGRRYEKAVESNEIINS